MQSMLATNREFCVTGLGVRNHALTWLTSPGASLCSISKCCGPAFWPTPCREALYLLSLGQSPYEGSAYHGAPLLLPLLAGAAQTDEPLARVAPFIAADLVAGFALWRLAAGTYRPGDAVPARRSQNTSML